MSSHHPSMAFVRKKQVKKYEQKNREIGRMSVQIHKQTTLTHTQKQQKKKTKLKKCI